MNCNHLTWLRLSNVKDVTLIDTGRLTRLISELDDSSNQWSTLLLFVSRKAKQIALKEIYSYNNVRKDTNEDIIFLRSETTSIHIEYSIFFAESDSFKSISSQAESHEYCHDTSSTSLQWVKSVSNDLFDIIHARLFDLFIDVLCIFADDFKNFDSVVHTLTTWASLNRTSVLLKKMWSKIIIVKRETRSDSSFMYDILQSENMHYNLHQKSLIEFFFFITVLHIVDQQISPLARHRRLKELIQRQTKKVRHLRHFNRCLYSAVHFNYFFKNAIKHTAQTIQESFSFVLSSRKENRIEVEYVQHLKNFLQLHFDHNISLDVLSRYIASTILMNVYSSDMHSKLHINTMICVAYDFMQSLISC